MKADSGCGPVWLPVPPRPAVPTSPLELVAIRRVAALVPVVAGAKTTVTVQLAAGRRVPPQLFEATSNAAGSAPVREIDVTTKAEDPVLVTVNASGIEAEPVWTLPKFLVEGETEIEKGTLTSPTAVEKLARQAAAAKTTHARMEICRPFIG